MTAFVQDEAERWDDVRVFLFAVRHQTLGQAAQRLGVDVSTVSRRLTALEERLSTKLFTRSRSGLTLTRAGKLMVPSAEAMEAAHQRMTRDVSAADSSAEGVVRVSLAPGLSELFVAPLIAKLRARYPRLRVQLDEQTRVVDLDAHEADIAIRSVEPVGASLLITKLGTASWVPVASRKLVSQRGPVERWDELPWIGWDSGLEHIPPARWLSRTVPHAELALATNGFATQLAAARAGVGLVLAPEPFVDVAGLMRIKVGKKLAPTLDSLPRESMWFACHRSVRDVPRVAAVWELLVRELRVAMGTAMRDAVG